MYLEQNLKGLCHKNGIDYLSFLEDLDVEEINELTLYDLEAIAEEYETDLYAMLFKPMFDNGLWKKELSKIKLLILDVDGVMTDGGMYFTENGDQFKKFNTKDGMAIIHLTKNDFQVAIISSGFVSSAVEARSKMLGIQNCIVTREPKLEVLQSICTQLKIDMTEVAIVGDDINDIPIMEKVGFVACPKDAVQEVKRRAHVVLKTKGGHGCVREFIEDYILQKPLEK